MYCTVRKNFARNQIQNRRVFHYVNGIFVPEDEAKIKVT